jgi:hypothetical protein
VVTYVIGAARCFTYLEWQAKDWKSCNANCNISEQNWSELAVPEEMIIIGGSQYKCFDTAHINGPFPL